MSLVNKTMQLISVFSAAEPVLTGDHTNMAIALSSLLADKLLNGLWSSHEVLEY